MKRISIHDVGPLEHVIKSQEQSATQCVFHWENSRETLHAKMI